VVVAELADHEEHRDEARVAHDGRLRCRLIMRVHRRDERNGQQQQDQYVRPVEDEAATCQERVEREAQERDDAGDLGQTDP
jgi:hypothetical protein